MQTPILHRSLRSPYAQKVMLLMGYLGQTYLSFVAPKGIPRPIEEILVGQYSRRIPLLQIGSDIYCDSELINRVLAERCGAIELTQYPSITEAQQWEAKIETQINPAIVSSIKPLELICAYFQNMPPNHAWRFVSDRIKLAKTLKLADANLPHHQKLEKVTAYLASLNQQLANSQYLLTQKQPTTIDFTAFTMVYFLDTINGLAIAQDFIHLIRWYRQMSALGTGNYSEIKGKQSLEVAKNTSPAPIAPRYLNSPQIGQTISYRNKGFMAQMNQGVDGVIVGEDQERIILRRDNTQVGQVHLHFPKLNY